MNARVFFCERKVYRSERAALFHSIVAGVIVSHYIDPMGGKYSLSSVTGSAGFVQPVMINSINRMSSIL